MKNYSLLILIAAIVGLSSCSSLRIEKRHYTGGWYVDFGNNTNSREDASEQKKIEPDQVSATTVADDQPAAQVAITTTETSEQNQTAVSGAATSDVKSSSTDPVVQKSDVIEKPQPPIVKQNQNTENPASNSADTKLILEFILALLIPPLAIYLHEGVTDIFWIDLICFIFVFAWFTPFAYGGLLHLLAIVLAMLVIFDVL